MKGANMHGKFLPKTTKSFFWISMFLGFLSMSAGFFSINLRSAGHWQLDLIEWQEASRQTSWGEVVAQKKDDAFVQQTYADRDSLIRDKSLYSYGNIPAYLFYKALGLRGYWLWMGQKIFLCVLWLVLIGLFFWIGNFCYGAGAGLLAAATAAFSPHLWIAFNFDGAIQRAYNFFLCMLIFSLFLLAITRNKKVYFILTGLLVGLNFLFFHIGSFMLPFVLMLSSIYLALKENKKKYYFTSFLLLMTSACIFAAVVIFLHNFYFHLPNTSPEIWLKGYFSKGGAASHSFEGLVLKSPKLFFTNIWTHLRGILFDGKTGDWHYIISPPGIPYLYNPVMSVLFFVGIAISFIKRRREDVLFLVWFFAFFSIYGLIIVARQKNLLWELPPLIFLASGGAFRLNEFKRIRINKMILPVTAVATTILMGFVHIFFLLPSKNFYDGGGYMGTRQLYKVLQDGHYSPKSRLIFTSPQVTVGIMMSRLFTQGLGKIQTLSDFGIVAGSSSESWAKIERDLLDSSDRLFYAFLYFENSLGFKYVTDDFIREDFEKFHPGSEPQVIMGVNGRPVWRIYQVNSENLKNFESAPAPVSSEVSWDETLIGGTFKGLSKVFVAIANIDQIKSYGAKKLNKMSDGKFESKYEKVYGMLSLLPEKVKQEYQIQEKMTRETALGNLEMINKKKINELIDSIPASTAGKMIKQQLKGEKDPENSGKEKMKIKNLWDKIMNDLNTKVKE